MFRDLLVHVDASAAGRRRLDYALSMASKLNARLTGTHVLTPPDIPPIYKPSFVDQAVAEEGARLHISALAASELFEAATKDAGVPVRWRAATGNMARIVCEQARSADLVIVGQYEREGSPEHHPFSLAHDVVLQGGQPVIVTPNWVEPFRDEEIVVAWDGSPQSVRALHDALPLLREASEVTILTVDSEGQTPSTRRAYDDLVDHLGQEDIGVDCIRHLATGGEDTGAILDHVAGHKVDLLVMGAYGRPAWIEWIFGGTTTDVIRTSPTPVFLSH